MFFNCKKQVNTAGGCTAAITNDLASVFLLGYFIRRNNDCALRGLVRRMRRWRGLA